MAGDINLIKDAFSDLEKLKPRFLDCERAFRAVYKEDNRTTKRKNTDLSRSKLYIPLIKTTVLIIHSIFKTSFMSDRCPIEITRVGLRSDDDLILQNALTAVLKNKWKKSEHRIGLSKAVFSALYLPLGITSLFYDSGSNDIRTRFIPITDLAFDKYASDISDIEYVAYRWSQSMREVKQKFNSGLYKSKQKDTLIGSNAKNSDRVKMQDLYEKSYERGRIKWKLKSYANEILVREATFSRLPFHFGYCIEEMPSIDLAQRADENAVYGSCIPEIAREIQKEYNIKRNQKIDITERQIDPPIAVDKDAGGVAVSDLSMNKKYVRMELRDGKKIGDVIQVLGQPGTYGLSEEIAMLKGEYEITTGVNSVMTGQTSPSDRRAMGALQTVNAASSMRIESMLQTLMETMLLSYAEHFVELIYRHTSDEDFIKITEDPEIINTIGQIGERKETRLDFDVNVNFGTTIANEVKIAQLNSVLGMLAQNGVGSMQVVGGILKEILTLILGENAPLEAIDEALAQANSPQDPQTDEINDRQDETQPQNLSQEDMDMQGLLNGGV